MMNINKEYYIDTLTILSCIAVVCLHANGIFWTHPSGRLWLTSNVIESFFYFAVPVFFMISGATLLEYRQRYSTLTFIKKRFLRAFVPFISWSLFAIVVFYITVKRVPNINEILSIPLDIINCKYFSIYWFFIPLFTCYLSIIYLSRIINFFKLSIFLILWIFISVSIFPFISSLLHIEINRDLLATPPGGGYIIYVIAGYLLSRYSLSSSLTKIVYLLGFAGLTLHCFGTWYLGLDVSKPINGLFKGYLNFPAIFYSIAVFLFIKNHPVKSIYFVPVVSFIAKKIKENSLGIYLIHGWFIYWIIPKIGINQASIIYRIIGPFVIIALCLVICSFVRKIPILRKIV